MVTVTMRKGEREREKGKKLEAIQGGGGCYSSGGEKVGGEESFRLGTRVI